MGLSRKRVFEAVTGLKSAVTDFLLCHCPLVRLSPLKDVLLISVFLCLSVKHSVSLS